MEEKKQQFVDKMAELARAGERVSRKQILQTLEELEKAKNDIWMNANKGYAIRNMFLKIRG